MEDLHTLYITKQLLARFHSKLVGHVEQREKKIILETLEIYSRHGLWSTAVDN